MKKQCLYSCILMLLVFSSGTYAQEPTLAFPGAEGFGRFAKGGRGGRVIEVTNLNDSGPGSLRAALTASGPRTVVFRVGGTINLTDHIWITKPFLTIAGQTAPGDGIQLKGGGLGIKASDVIIRYLRSRPGPTVPDHQNNSALQIIRNTSGPAVTNVIVDHVSLSWAENEVFTIWGTATQVFDVTLQWSIISEGLHCANHPLGCHSKAALLGNGTSGITLHHNLLVHNVDRHPTVQGGNQDFVNNIIYNWGSVGVNLFPMHSVLNVNYVGNHFIPGPSLAHHTTPPIQVKGNDDGGAPFADDSRVYLDSNVHPVLAPTGTEAQENLLKITTRHGRIPITQSEFNFPPLTTTNAFQAKTDVLANAGATLPRRDPVDTRIVNDVRKGTGRIIDSPSQVGGYPTLSSGTPLPDTDHDGMPDSWEVAQGFNPKNASDGPQDADSDGYTNLEEYLNDTKPVADLAPSPPQNVRIR